MEPAALAVVPSAEKYILGDGVMAESEAGQVEVLIDTIGLSLGNGAGLRRDMVVVLEIVLRLPYETALGSMYPG